MQTWACLALLLLLASGAVHVEAAEPAEIAAYRLTAGAGPLHSSGDGGVPAASAQGGPVGAAAVTVDGSLTFVDGSYLPSVNVLQFATQGETADAAFLNQVPLGVAQTISPPYGNTGTNGPVGVEIKKDWTEFATSFFAHSNAGAAQPLGVFADLTLDAAITITWQAVGATAPPLSTLVGTLTLQSALFIGATSVDLIDTRASMEGVLGDSFELEQPKEGGPHQAASAAPKDGTMPKRAATKAVRPALTWGTVGAEVTDSEAGIITFTIPAPWIPGGSQKKQFQVAFGPSPCDGGGLCCDDQGNLKNGTVCKSAPPGSCQLDTLCDGVNAECPTVQPNKPNWEHCFVSPKQSYLMGGAADAGNTMVVSVSAHDAAAWLTGQPAYNTEWPECEGKCINGACTLAWDHPGCCFVHPHDDYYPYEHRGYQGRPYADKEAEAEVPVSSFGYWRSRDWYCWK